MLKICWNCGKDFTAPEAKAARRRGKCPECGGPAHDIITLPQLTEACRIMAAMEQAA